MTGERNSEGGILGSYSMFCDLVTFQTSVCQGKGFDSGGTLLQMFAFVVLSGTLDKSVDQIIYVMLCLVCSIDPSHNINSFCVGYIA